MNEKSDIYSGLKQLGHAVEMPTSPEQAQLETVANPHPDVDYCAVSYTHLTLPTILLV